MVLALACLANDEDDGDVSDGGGVDLPAACDCTRVRHVKRDKPELRQHVELIAETSEPIGREPIRVDLHEDQRIRGVLQKVARRGEHGGRVVRRGDAERVESPNIEPGKQDVEAVSAITGVVRGLMIANRLGHAVSLKIVLEQYALVGSRFDRVNDAVTRGHSGSAGDGVQAEAGASVNDDVVHMKER